jgi:hypothetical protein
MRESEKVGAPEKGTYIVKYECIHRQHLFGGDEEESAERTRWRESKTAQRELTGGRREWLCQKRIRCYLRQKIQSQIAHNAVDGEFIRTDAKHLQRD